MATLWLLLLLAAAPSRAWDFPWQSTTMDCSHCTEIDPHLLSCGIWTGTVYTSECAADCARDSAVYCTRDWRTCVDLCYDLVREMKTVRHEDVCRSATCPDHNASPVCGITGLVYSNACNARCLDVAVVFHCGDSPDCWTKCRDVVHGAVV